MGRGKISDPEWRGSFCTFAFFVLIFYMVEGMTTMIFLGIHRTVDFDDMPEEYVFHLRGNMSIFHPNVYNRTDQHGLWTPPPGTCIAS